MFRSLYGLGREAWWARIQVPRVEGLSCFGSVLPKRWPPPLLVRHRRLLPPDPLTHPLTAARLVRGSGE